MVSLYHSISKDFALRLVRKIWTDSSDTVNDASHRHRTEIGSTCGSDKASPTPPERGRPARKAVGRCASGCGFKRVTMDLNLWDSKNSFLI